MNKSISKFTLGICVCLVITGCQSPSASLNLQQEKVSREHHMMTNGSFGYVDSVNSGLIQQDTMKGSPSTITMASVGKTHLHIRYHSPGVKGRVIWGGLVPYDQVWVTGAHTATSLQINNPISINGRQIDTGTYAIFTIPGSKEWTFILNRNHSQHLADDYSATDDVLRLQIKPEANDMTQRLSYEISSTGDNKGVIIMKWEKIRIDVPFETYL